MATSPSLVRSGYAPVNGLEVYFEVHGSGPPLVSIHGGAGLASAFPLLAARHTLIAMDLQGHGRTRDRDGPFSFEQNADDVAALLRHLGIARADVLGECFGGTAALVLGMRHPDLVDRIVTYGASLRAGGGPPFTADSPAIAFQRERYERLAPDPGHFPVVFQKIGGMVWDGFTPAKLRHLKGRVLIGIGDHDFIPIPVAMEMAAMIPDSQLAVVPGAGHFLFSVDPDRFLFLALRFLERRESVTYATPLTGYIPGVNI